MCVLSVYGVKLFINFLKCIKKLTLLRDGLKKVPNTEVFRPPSLGHLQFLIRLVKEYFIPYFFLPSGLPQFILFYIISYKRDSIEIGSPPSNSQDGTRAVFYKGFTYNDKRYWRGYHFIYLYSSLTQSLGLEGGPFYFKILLDNG